MLKVIVLSLLFSLSAFSQVQRDITDGQSAAYKQTLSLNFNGSSDLAPLDSYSRAREATSIGSGYTNLEPGMSMRYERSYRWWAGFSASYSQGSWDQVYNSKDGPGAIAHINALQRLEVSSHLRDLSGAYLLKGKSLKFGIRPYAEFGAGALTFDYAGNMRGTEWSGQVISPHNPYMGVATQTRFTGNGAIGMSVDMRKHLGFRAGYRGIAYISPDFHTGQSNYKQYTIMQQPVMGLFLKF